MLLKRKKAIMGIGTLIIFIATILVAAVAAGVLISTSGVLQQRALITGQEARQKITDSVETVSIVAYGNRSDESLNNFESMIRLDAGSDPIQMKGFGLSFIGPDQHASARLAHPQMNDPAVDPEGFLENVSVSGGILDNTSQHRIRDLDGDGVGERISIVTRDGNDALLINFSSSRDKHALVNLRTDISNLSESKVYRLKDGPIVDENNEYYGFVNIRANITQNATIDLADDYNYMKLSKYYIHDCTFDAIPYEDRYCFEVMHGDDDTVLDNGEMFMVKFKLRPENRMFINEQFEMIYHTESGRMRTYQARTPAIITSTRVQLWPVG